MKHLVASSIAVPSVPCFHPNLSFLFSMSQGLYTRKTWSTERPNDQKNSSLLQPLPGAPKCGSYALSTTETPVIVEKLSSTENP